ncbi:Parvalbumin [Thalictrum thalictroides]|uniref:Parvalbumin n=1 Tax=Thalictrum thalictroides TaxID=46969 RepID=A0A7J6WZ76_THATH|nr:Parvalbumin [Thalictrum thalictroides]
MEDWNYLAADGVVICCCCPCAILQVVVFILLKLPYKLASKSKKLVYKKLRKNKKRKEQIPRGEVIQHGGGGQQIRIQGELSRILLEGVSLHPNHDCIKTLNEIEKAMEELSQQGHFQFGSFWGRDESSGLQQDVPKEKFENVLHYQFIEMIKNL